MPFLPIARVRPEDLGDAETLRRLLAKAISDCLRLMDAGMEVKDVRVVRLPDGSVGISIETPGEGTVTRADEEAAFERWLDQV